MPAPSLDAPDRGQGHCSRRCPLADRLRHPQKVFARLGAGAARYSPCGSAADQGARRLLRTAARSANRLPTPCARLESMAKACRQASSATSSSMPKTLHRINTTQSSMLSSRTRQITVRDSIDAGDAQFSANDTVLRSWRVRRPRSRVFGSALTTLRQDFGELGRRACLALTEQIEVVDRPDTAAHEVLPPRSLQLEMVLRDSCARPRPAPWTTRRTA